MATFHAFMARISRNKERRFPNRRCFGDFNRRSLGFSLGQPKLDGDSRALT